MIIDSVDRLLRYVGSDYSDAVTEIINECPKMEVGVYEHSEGVVVKRISTRTKPEDIAKIESHEKHIDIQMPLDIDEKYKIYFPDENKVVSKDDEKDVRFYDKSVRLRCEATVRPGEFILLMPGELHQPQIAVGEPEPIEKLVIKLEVQRCRRSKPWFSMWTGPLLTEAYTWGSPESSSRDSMSRTATPFTK